MTTGQATDVRRGASAREADATRAGASHQAVALERVDRQVDARHRQAERRGDRPDRRGAVTSAELPQHSPRAWRIEPANAGWRRPLRRPIRPLARNAHALASGQTSQRGSRAAHLAPEVHDRLVPVAGRLAPPATARQPRRHRHPATSSGSAANSSRAITLRTFVSIAATGEPYAIDVTAAAVYGPIPGRASNAEQVGWHGPAVIADDAASRLVQRCGAPRVPQSAPRAQDVSPRGFGERGHVGEPGHEDGERLDHARCLRLLQHHLGDEHRVRIPLALTPRVNGAVRSEPREQRALRRRAFVARPRRRASAEDTGTPRSRPSCPSGPSWPRSP